jgi:hypothetical protein
MDELSNAIATILGEWQKMCGKIEAQDKRILSLEAAERERISKNKPLYTHSDGKTYPWPETA